jgi:hypothetical protein
MDRQKDRKCPRPGTYEPEAFAGAGAVAEVPRWLLAWALRSIVRLFRTFHRKTLLVGLPVSHGSLSVVKKKLHCAICVPRAFVSF